ncbi:hypothetical protein HMI55_003268 [Coelomomyces lativittatus]|nr:hypothetical protein HMI55_003268 [Coelomomyces lativittatus]
MKDIKLKFKKKGREHHGSSHSTQRNFQNIETQEESPQSGKEKQAHVNDGFDVLKEKLLKAKYRLQAIKFGIPLSKTLQSTTWLEEAKPVQTVTSSTESFHDWTPSKLDREKMIHYLRLLLPTFSNPMPTNDTKPSSSSSPPPPASSSSTVILPKLVKPSKDHRSSVLEMEHALMIQRPQLPDPETLVRFHVFS